MKKRLKRIQLLTMLGFLLSTNPRLAKDDVDFSFLEEYLAIQSILMI